MEWLETLKPYWPLFTQIVVIWYLGQFFKKRVWTKARSQKGGFFKLMRDTLRLHPLAAGALWGSLYPWLPAVEFVTTRGGAVTEGLLAGFLYAAWAILGYVVDIARPVAWRSPILWPVFVPYVLLYLSSLRFYWWPLALISRPLWFVYAALFIISTILNITSH